MIHAFLILAHKNPLQVGKMISALQSENSIFFVHVDRKYGNVYNEIYNSQKEFHNVYISDIRINVNWGGFSQIEATMHLINMLMQTKMDIDYVHLLSGQDFLLCCRSQIDSFFRNHNNSNFMEYFTIPDERWSGNGGLDRILYVWDIDDKKDGSKIHIPELKKRSFINGVQAYGGSQWWSLTGKCIVWLAAICKPDNIVYEFYKSTYIPDEMFFQTIIMNSPFAKSVVNDNLRYIDWTRGTEYPRILTKDDWNRIVKSKKIFARKFDYSIDSFIFDFYSSQKGIFRSKN